jgi:hypothetical protein
LFTRRSTWSHELPSFLDHFPPPFFLPFFPAAEAAEAEAAEAEAAEAEAAEAEAGEAEAAGEGGSAPRSPALPIRWLPKPGITICGCCNPVGPGCGTRGRCRMAFTRFGAGCCRNPPPDMSIGGLESSGAGGGGWRKTVFGHVRSGWPKGGGGCVNPPKITFCTWDGIQATLSTSGI